MRGAKDGVGEKAGSKPSPLMVERHSPMGASNATGCGYSPAPLRTREGASSIEMLAIDQA